MTVTISIAMATYNGEVYLQAQLDSLKAQICQPAELIVTDDRSTDRTVEILENFASNSPFPVIIVRNDMRLGYADNFLKAAKLCSSPYIAFCDQDDVWMDSKLACMSVCLEKKPAMVVHAGQATDAQLNPIDLKIPNIQKSESSRNILRSIPNGCAIVFSKDILLDADLTGRFPSSNRLGLASHDEFVFVLALAWGEIEYTKDILMLYRRHGLTATQFDEHLLKNPQKGRGIHVSVQEFDETIEIMALRRDYFVRRIDAGVSPLSEATFRDAIALYDRVIEFARRRKDIHHQQTAWVTKYAEIFRLVRQGAYTAGLATGFSFRSLAKDVAATMLSAAR